MKVKGTANAMYIMKNICEQVIERHKNIFLCFIDYEKVFDKVQQLFNLLANTDIYGFKTYYYLQTCIEIDRQEWIGQRKSQRRSIKKTVRQVYVLSPFIFSY